MIIQSSCQKSVCLIVGVCGSSSFYETFDKVLNEEFNRVTIASLQDQEYLKNLFDLVRKIRSHWNKTDDSIFEAFIQQNPQLFKNFLSDSKGYYQELILSTQDINKGFQNTKLSKFLYILTPDFIPMIDSRQGNLLVKKYKKDSRGDLVEVIKTFHKHFYCNRKKVGQIQNVLRKDYSISLRKLRIFELLIWLQENLKEKEIKMQIIK